MLTEIMAKVAINMLNVYRFHILPFGSNVFMNIIPFLVVKRTSFIIFTIEISNFKDVKEPAHLWPNNNTINTTSSTTVALDTH